MNQPVYAPGTIVAGKYRIDKAIARGGCSIVYRGTHIDMQRSVALKIMTPEVEGNDEAWTQRFQREAKLASQLRHPNTITTYDHGHDNGLWYIIMEWVEGASMRNVIREEGPIDPERTARLTIQMLKSLEEAHRNKILHRDMKPSNIMLTVDMDGEEQVKVLDFGLAKADPTQLGGDLLKLTRDGDFVGTPRYASPEQLKGRPLTNASDIYGVGMVMWEMLTGAPAVPEVDYAVCVEHHLGPRPWRLTPGQFPPGLAMIVEKALDKDPAKRFASCQEMRKALRDWLELSGKARATDIFDTLDGNGDDSKQDLFADALSDALNEMSSESFDEAPLELHGGRQRTPPPSPSPLAGGLGAGLSEGSSSAATEDDPPERRSFSSLNSSQLELELAAKKRPVTRTSQSVSTQYTPHRGSPAVTGRSPVASAELPSRDGSRYIALVLVAIIAVIAIGILWHQSRQVPQQEQVDPSHEAFLENLRHQESQRKAVLERAARADDVSATRVLEVIAEQGWKPEHKPATVSINGMRQTNARLERGVMEVDMTLYECQDAALADDLQDQADSPTEAFRIKNTVIWLTPAGSLGKESLQSLKALLTASFSP